MHADLRQESAKADPSRAVTSLDDLLLATSRTFAACIPLLAEPTRSAVRTAYLLFRIADTFEDAASWSRATRRAELEDFMSILERTDLAAARESAARWVAARPTEHEGYLDLLRETPQVLQDLDRHTPEAREVVVRHTLRTAAGMIRFVDRSDEAGGLVLRSVLEVKDYCYVVAGIVGELLTELFVLAAPSLAAVRGDLDAHQIAFGEGLQLVNVLKDTDDDARDGRRYVPEGKRAELMELAREDLRGAERYVAALARGGAPRETVVFTALPLLLARATLDRLAQDGPGAKVGRAVVAAALLHVASAPLDDRAASMLAFCPPESS